MMWSIPLRVSAQNAGRRACLLLAVGVAISLVWAAFQLAFIMVPLPTRLAELDSPVMLYDNDEIAHVGLAQDHRWRFRVDLDGIDPKYVSALLTIEDSRFYEHGGVDILAILRATFQNIAARRVVSGASTITMQLVRLLEPRPRTLRSKAIEAFRAYQLESRYTKREILEEYLRFIPFGRNYEGIGIGTQALFGKSPRTLTTHQIATLIAIPQAPAKRYPSHKNVNNLELGSKRILERLKPNSRVDATVRLAAQNNIPTGYRKLPQEARHVAAYLHQTSAQQRHATNLNRGLQTQLKRRLNNLQEGYRRQGIRHGSVLIADHTNAQIKAAMGSFNFEHRDAGQVIGFTARRSVGSTLKPYIYALALDRGLALPKMLVPDIPRQFGAYTPSNYDGQYRGLVPMDEALKASYNLPFIHLLESLTPDILAQLLSSTRLSGYHTQTDIDLTGAVGGIALRPLDLLGLYTALAQNGMYQRPTFERHAVRSKPLQIISPGAALLTKRALTTQQRPEFSHATQLKAINGAIHWKTGTSFGHRDAWAIGSNRRYTVLVWLGNFDNQPSRSLVGRESAGPLLFDILSELSAVKNFTSQRLTTLAPLKTIATCAATGYPAHPSCPESRPQQIPVHAPIHAVDPYLRAYRTDPKTGLAINHACRPNASVLAKPFFKLSWAIRQHISPGQLRYPLQPSFAKGCGDVFTSGDLSILEPTPHRTYLLIAGLDAKRQQIRLRADQSGVTGHLDWFVDGEHVGRAHHGHPVYWTPTSGTHRVSVKNGAGIVKHGKFRVL